MTRTEARELPLQSPVRLCDGRTGEVIGFYTNSDAVIVQVRHGSSVVLTSDRLTVTDDLEVRECQPHV